MCICKCYNLSVFFDISQACAFLAAVICVVITVIVMVDTLNLAKRKEEPTTNYK